MARGPEKQCGILCKEEEPASILPHINLDLAFGTYTSALYIHNILEKRKKKKENPFSEPVQ